MIQFPLNSVPTLWSQILELGRSAKRILTFGNNLLLNSNWCSLFIKKMPCHDENLWGRLRDHYAILLDIVDSRLMLIQSIMNQEREQEEALLAIEETRERFENMVGLSIKRDNEIRQADIF